MGMLNANFAGRLAAGRAIMPSDRYVESTVTGEVTVNYRTPVEHLRVHPVAKIETDLEVLRRAGITPQQFACEGLLTPSNPSSLQAAAENHLSKIAHDIDSHRVNNNPQNQVENE